MDTKKRDAILRNIILPEETFEAIDNAFRERRRRVNDEQAIEDMTGRDRSGARYYWLDQQRFDELNDFSKATWRRIAVGAVIVAVMMLLFIVRLAWRLSTV